MRALKIVGWVVLGVVGVAALAFVLGIGVMLLWNALMPDIFGLPAIGYWQAVGLLVLSHLLLGAGHQVHARRDAPRRAHGRLAARVRSHLGPDAAPAQEGPATT